MNITHDMSNDLTEYDPESRQVDGPNPIENRISSSAARVPDIISCTSGITVQGRQLHSFAFTTDAAIIRNTNADAILAVYPFTGEPVITQALLTAAQAPLFVGVGGGTTTGPRVIQLAMMAEMQGAAGVVLNAPAPPSSTWRPAAGRLTWSSRSGSVTPPSRCSPAAVRPTSPWPKPSWPARTR